MVPQVFFHVGLGKTASTFLQKCIFPSIEGLCYIPPSRYRAFKRGDLYLRPGVTYLVSRELDRQLESELRVVAARYPGLRVIVCFRRHGEWLGSQYRRYVKNGWYSSFSSFFDLKGDEGLWKKQDLEYSDMLDFIKSVSREPLVLDYHALRANPQRFIHGICTYTHSIFPKKVPTRAVHKSYTDAQLKVLYLLNRRFLRYRPQGHENKWKHWLCYRPVWLAYHVVLSASRVVPAQWTEHIDLIPAGVLEDVDAYYEQDWRRMQEAFLYP